mmetsp:Transcript_17508/g.32942  ORF Transcript_17508/g.32942 Transcript_17508/m.32942 type:complete len:207 (-) Transcript_17508:56-676(-)
MAVAAAPAMISLKALWVLLLPFVGAVRAAREGRSDLGLLEVEHSTEVHTLGQQTQQEMQQTEQTKQAQQTHLMSLGHVANSAAAGELLVFRMLTGQSKKDLWTQGMAGYNVSRTLDAYHIDSAMKLKQAIGAATDTKCMGSLLFDSAHRCHKAFPIYDLMLTTWLVLLLAVMTSYFCCGCCCGLMNGSVKTCDFRMGKTGQGTSQW